MSTTIKDKKTEFLDQFSGQANLLSGDYAERVYNEARFALSELDFPTTRTEAWKYTRVSRILNGQWSFRKASSPIDISQFTIDNQVSVITFVNGYFRNDLSCVHEASGLSVRSLEEAEEIQGLVETHYDELTRVQDDVFSALNSAHVNGGVVIHLRKDTQLTQPVHILHLTEGNDVVSMPRHLVILEESSQLDLVISNHSLDGGKSFSNSVSEFFIAENASLHIDKFQQSGEQSFELCTEHVSQEANSRFHINTITQSGLWTRNNLNIAVNGVNCETNLYGTYSPRNKSHVDNHTVVDHIAPHCESNELYKGLLYDNSTGVFNGKVFVRQAAQKTNAFQQNANIVMSDDATINSKPELEIYADDVKCSHGSTTGQFDEEAVFYLQARGISESNARELLTEAFVGEVLEAIKNYPRSFR